mgnify:CR=1 FL=1|jgi:competence protein ComGC
MASLLEQVKEQEAIQENVKIEKNKRKKAVSKIMSNGGIKDKQISAKVNEKSWENFTKINKAQGLSNNSALNMIINKYIRENKGIIDE